MAKVIHKHKDFISYTLKIQITDADLKKKHGVQRPPVCFLIWGCNNMFISLLFFKLNIYVLRKSDNSLGKRSKKGPLTAGSVSCK